MEHWIKEALAESAGNFDLPQYNEIPSVGLYLEQVTKYISEHLAPLQGVSITSSMISNYVKKGLVSNPVKKQYDREQIAALLIIAIAKTVLSIDDTKLMLEMQTEIYKTPKGYDYFRTELLNVLYFVFGVNDKLFELESEPSDGHTMLRNMIITVAYKVYLDKCFALLQESKKKDE